MSRENRVEKSLSLPLGSSQSCKGNRQTLKYNKIIALLEVCVEKANPGSLPREGSIGIGTCRPSRSLKGELVRES